MAYPATAHPPSHSTYHESSRREGDVLVGEDNARLVIEASSSGNDVALQGMLVEPQWTKIMLEMPQTIYQEWRPSLGPDDLRRVGARPMLNVERALEVACQNNHPAVAYTLLAFATQQGIDARDIISRIVVYRNIRDGRHNMLRAFGSAEPHITDYDVNHGAMALHEAIKIKRYHVIWVLLELGADPLRQARFSRDRIWPLLAMASRARYTYIAEVLLEHGVPVADAGALHDAASLGNLDTMRLLLEHGADVNEVRSKDLWTPMHCAAELGRESAMKLLEQRGARCDLENKDGKTPMQLFEEHKNKGTQ